MTEQVVRIGDAEFIFDKVEIDGEKQISIGLRNTKTRTGTTVLMTQYQCSSLGDVLKIVGAS